MVERDGYGPGVFSWVDICTPDTEAAKDFYSELFTLNEQFSMGG